MRAHTILETLRQPVRAHRAITLSLAFVAFGVAVAAAQALTKPAPGSARVDSASALKPIILAIDWREDSHSHDGRAVALAYSR